MRTGMLGLVLAAGLTAGAVLASAGVAGPAVADPGVTPAATDIVSVGSATTQGFDNDLSTAYNATGSSPITDKAGAVSWGRPNGDYPGLQELFNTASGTVDIARSSQGPTTGSSLWFIAFAADAVGWSAFTGGNAPHDLTSADLQGIYGCTITSWNQITDEPGYSGPAAIDVVVPATDSSERAFFLTALGLAGVPSCWKTTTPPPNEGTDPVFAGDVNAVFPYSLGHYVGQVYDGRGTATDAPGVLDADRSIDGVERLDTANKVWNPNLSLTFQRSLYHVVRQSDWADPTAGRRLKALLDRASNGGRLCADGAALITARGFQPLGACCGTLVAGGLPSPPAS